MKTITTVLDAVLSVLRWPRRKLAAIGYEVEYRRAYARTLAAELDRQAATGQGYGPVGSMQYDADPAARQPGYLGTWQPHPEPWGHLPDDDDWVDRLITDLQAAPAAPPSRLATADDWETAYFAPDFERQLAAEQGALERSLEKMTAAWHHQQHQRGLTS